MASSITRRFLALILGLMMAFSMIPMNAQAATLSASATLNQPDVAVNQPITADFTISGGTAPYTYNYYWMIDSTYMLGQGTGTGPSGSVTYTPLFGANAVFSLNANDSVAGYAYAESTFTITGSVVADPLTGGVTLDNSTVIAGQMITADWTVAGGTPPYSLEYWWDIYDVDGLYYGSSDYFTSNLAIGSSTFTPPTGDTGSFSLQIFDAFGRDLYVSSDIFTITGSPAPLDAMITLDPQIVTLGNSITADWTLSGGVTPVSTDYSWWTTDASGTYTEGTHTTTPDMGGTSTFTPPAGSASGFIQLDVNLGGGLHKFFFGDFTIVEPLVITSVTSDVASTIVGQPIVWTITASGGEPSKYYGFKVLRDGVQVMDTGLIVNNSSYSYIPTQPGTYTVIATVSDLLNTDTSGPTAAVTVTPAPPSMFLSPGNGSMKIGNTLQLTAVVSPIDTGNVGLTWDTSNAAVATVSATGLVTAVGTGLATITATSPGLMITATASFIVLANVPVQTGTLTYNGQVQQPTFAPLAGASPAGYYTWNGGTQSATNAGTYYAIASINDDLWASGMKWNLPYALNMSQTASISWVITKLDLSAVIISPVAAQAYTGSPIYPTPQVSIPGYVLQPGVDFIYQYQANINPGTYTVTIIPTPNNNTTGTNSISFDILHVPVTPPAAVTGLTFNGIVQTGVNTVPAYSLTGNTATNAGNYTATATLTNLALNQWDDLTSGPKTISWSIAPRQIALTDFAYNNSNQAYTGSPLTLLTLTPAGFVTVNDYDIVYSNNTDPGTATATITGKNNYTGSVQITFQITSSSVTPPAAVTGLTFDGTVQTGVNTGAGYSLAGNTATDAGDYTATATLTDAINTAWSDSTTAPKTINWSIAPKTISLTDFTIVPGTHVFTGLAQTLDSITPKAPVTVLDYDVTYADNINIGTATATFTGKNNYTGSVQSTFQITSASQHPAAKITKIEAINGSSLKITWSKVTGASGYEVWQSTDMAGVYTLVKTTTATSFTKTYLKPGTRYYYKIRTYDLIAGVATPSGDFSAVRTGVPLGKATVTSVISPSVKRLKITWTKVTGATGYIVYRSTTANGVYAKITATTALTFTNTGLTSGKTYYYKVKPYKQIVSALYYGPLSVYKSGKVK